MSEHSISNKKKVTVPAHLESALIISVKEARKVMGTDAPTLNDDEMMVEIWQLMEVASDLLKSVNISTEKQL